MKKNKGIEMDYGKPERFLFLERERQYHRWSKYGWIAIVVFILYFGFHIASALADVVQIVRCTPTSIGTVVCL
jgi:hypothetical protein